LLIKNIQQKNILTVKRISDKTGLFQEY